MPDLIRELGLEPALAQFEQLAERPGSPITALRRILARVAETVPLPEGVAPQLAAVLARRGIKRLYCHQADALDAIVAGRNAVIVTPAASGETLCYNLPVLPHLIENPAGRARYLFPTKALAEDQLHEFNGIVEAIGSDLRAFIYS